MKKTFSFIISFFFCFSAAFSQSQKSKDSLIKVMTAEACAEIKKKDFSSIQKEDLELELGMAVVPVFTKHAQEIKTILNLEITDGEKMKDFGQTLGIRLAVECPDFMRAVTSNKSLVDGIKKEKRMGSGSLSGTLIKIVPGEFTHFLVRDKQGKTEKIWWMEYFEGADKVSDAKNINKIVSVKFKEVEVYNAAIKDYITIKVVTAFDE